MWFLSTAVVTITSFSSKKLKEIAIKGKERMSERQINLLAAFTSWDRCSNMYVQLMEALKDAGLDVTVLALEGLSRIENDVKSDQFPGGVGNKVRDVLRQWRCESPLRGAYSGAYKRVPKFLRSLTIFTTFKVPLFIDDFGKKELLTNYTDSEDIRIDEETAIFHVTHSQEAEKIVKEQQLKPSDNKNIIEGTWFGLDESPSVYGSESFQTTLRDLGIKGLRQGEIVSYKHEVNVILYAEEGATEFKGLKKPTDEAVKKRNSNAYIHVSIFVPAKFLPSPDEFKEVISGPKKVLHGPFCVRKKRSNHPCTEQIIIIR